MPATTISYRTIRLGTRGSPLARWQADWVAARLMELGVSVELVLISTQGDRQQQGPIGAIGSQGVFTKEIQRALLEGQIDLAVHSLKDLPTEPVPGLCLAAVPPRGPSGDVLVSRDALTLDQLPLGSRVGTGSRRRRSQLLHYRADLKIEDVRGNVDTRLRKLHAGEYDALILAEAGLTRLDLRQHVTQVIPRSVMLPAVGQGALGLETRDLDTATRELLRPLDHAESHQAVLAERAMLAALRGGCLAPVGAWGRIEADGQLRLSGVVLSSDGRIRVASEAVAPPATAHHLGQQVAEQLIAQGADELIVAAREN